VYTPLKLDDFTAVLVAVTNFSWLAAP